MKICVFAHVPPPMHGQAYMTQLLLQVLQEWRYKDSDAPEVFHVDARVSRKAQEIGGMQLGKLLRLGSYILQAFWARVGERCTHLYYIPAPAKKSAILRDLLTLTVLRPFYPRLILHWHAMGLGLWVVGTTALFPGFLEGWMRKRLRRLLADADEAWILKRAFAEEVETFAPKKIRLLVNGIPDLFPDYDARLAHRRERRAEQLRGMAEEGQPKGLVRFLHLGFGSRDKGIFLMLGFLRGWAQAYPLSTPILKMCGTFASPEVEAEFREASQGLQVEITGPVAGREKRACLEGADALLFFSQLPETMGLVVLEAMSAGLLPLVIQGKGVESILEGTGLPAVDLNRAKEGVWQALRRYHPNQLRALFLSRYSLPVFASEIRQAIQELPHSTRA